MCPIVLESLKLFKVIIWPKTGFFTKFHWGNFSLLVGPYHAAKSEKKSLEQILDISWHNFGPQSDQNCLFGPKEEFSGNFS